MNAITDSANLRTAAAYVTKDMLVLIVLSVSVFIHSPST